ncbi:MAG: tyrosine-type recombinase/integrase [Candidatus Peregrinibacteria bacterium]|nr:tyrosine-type recombinase/integrase [Candidatus Peregrinibacteria bacterium]
MSFIRNQSCFNTKHNYRMEIALFYRAVGKKAAHISLQDLLGYRESLDARGLKPITISKKLTVIRRLFTFLYEQGVIPTNPSAGLKLPKTTNETTREILSLADCNRLLGSIETDTIRGKRDKAIMALLLINGLRVCEITRANVGDLVQTEGCWVLRVRGKGGKTIDTRIRDDVRGVIQTYLKTRGRVEEENSMFVGTTHRAKDRIARRNVQHMVKTRLKQLGIDRPHVSTHSLRHSSITHLINGGATLIAAQDFARHMNPATTQRYFHNLERLKNHAVMMQPIRV